MLRRCVAVFSALLAAACAAPRPAAAPATEFVVTTADSAFWVTSDRQGMHVRGVPLVLARVDGRFHEVYVADDDRSFYDAVFVGQRIFARDIATGDSTELFADTIVSGLARQYASAHPDEEPLAPDDVANERPRTTATADLEVLDVHGPYVSFEYHSDLDFTGERGRADRHAVRRMVVDVRDGTAPSLATLFGKEAADRAITAAEREWDRTRDSLLAAVGRPGRNEVRARPAFAFDAASFSLTAAGGAARVVFAVPGESSRGPLRPIELSPQAVAAPAWWRDAADELPTGNDSLDRWVRGRLSVVAQLDSAGDRARLTLHDSSRGTWDVGVVAAPVKRVFWLDANVSTESRKALRRAFNEASAYSEDTRIAAGQRRLPPVQLALSTFGTGRWP
jgi:hypothetical protein